MTRDELLAMLRPAVDEAVTEALRPKSPLDERYNQIRSDAGLKEPWWVEELAARIPDLNSIESSPALKAYLDENELVPDSPDESDNDGVKPL